MLFTVVFRNHFLNHPFDLHAGSAMLSRTASLQEIEAAPSGSLTGLTSASMRPAWMRPKAISFPLLVLWFDDILCLYRFYSFKYFHKNHKTRGFCSIMVSLISRFGISLSLMHKECKVDRQRRNRRRSFKTSRCLSRFATELNPFTSLRHFHLLVTQDLEFRSSLISTPGVSGLNRSTLGVSSSKPSRRLWKWRHMRPGAGCWQGSKNVQYGGLADHFIYMVSWYVNDLLSSFMHVHWREGMKHEWNVLL